MSDFTLEIGISFGDCDPAGIVFYPNYFRWFDKCFHAFLRDRIGGHATLCDRFGAKGLGLVHVDADFPAPAREGDVMHLHMRFQEWRARVVTLGYEGEVNGRVVVAGHEKRALFVIRNGKMRAGDLAEVRKALEPGA